MINNIIIDFNKLMQTIYSLEEKGFKIVKVHINFKTLKEMTLNRKVYLTDICEKDSLLGFPLEVNDMEEPITIEIA